MFWIIILKELLFFPFLILLNFISNKLSSKSESNFYKKRKPIKSNTIFVHLHDWGGYSLKRKKEIRNIKSFECGLYYQLHRFKGKNIKTSITLSNPEKHKDLGYIKDHCDILHVVDNDGMDFGGYAHFHDRIKSQDNSYVVLTNSSVNRSHDDGFLESHIQFMESNPEIGALGVSYSSKAYQTLITNNFNPHIQSFYIVTTIEVLNEIVDLNKSKFPGKGIMNKRILILKGEIQFSRLILKAGYKLAIVLEDKSVHTFGSKLSFWDNGFNRWNLRFEQGDIRTKSENPNKLYKIEI